MLKVVIIGYGEMFSNLIAGTLDAGCEIVGVLRKDSIKYPSWLKKLKDNLNPSQEYSYIKSYNLKEINVKSANSEKFKKQLLKLQPDIILIGSWGEVIKKEIYDIPKIATINAHPSLLPKYRGPNPYFWVIRNQEQNSGVTFHLLDEKLDTGAILAQEEIKIYPSDTGKTLKERTVLVARCVVCELLKDLQEDIIIPLQQREDRASYNSYPSDLELKFDKTSEENYALCRAIYPWGNAYFYYKDLCFLVNSQLVEIAENNTVWTEAGTVTDADVKNRMISILCKDNKVIKMKNLQLYTKKFLTKHCIKKEVVVGSVIKYN